MKILNLYAGIGGNRKLWGNEHEVTAVEIDPKIAEIYQNNFPKDKVIVADAHKFLLEHHKEFDFIWSSPPCPSHGISRYWSSKAENSKINYPAPIYPDMNLYQEIIFLKHFFKGLWVVENVISYYEPIIKPIKHRSHYYWCNFSFESNPKKIDRKVWKSQIQPLQKKTGFDLSGYKGINKLKLLRNCVEPEEGLFIFESALRNLSPTSHTLASPTFPTEKAINKDLTAMQQVASPKCPLDTSLNSDIKRNFSLGLRGR